MASEHQEKYKHAVHVLSCLNGECKPHIERLVQLLEERGVQCVYQARGDYGIGGLFATHFKNFFRSCERTVIHICQESIETVKEFEEILLDGAEKTSFFRIPCSPLDSSKFIKQFNVWDLSEEPVLKRFIEEISRKRSDSPDLPKASDGPSLPVSSDELHRVSPVVSPKTFKAVSFIHRGAVYPVLHVDESFLLPSSDEEHIRKSFQRNINPERSSKEDLFFILNEVLPDLYKQGDITRLSQLTRSHQPLLRDRALRYIELLLLLSEEPPPSVSDMKETETSLFSLFSDAETSKEDETLIRVIVTYLITLVRFIMACHSEGNDGECDHHLSAITHRKLFKNPKLMKNDKKSAIKKTGALIKVVQNCVHCWHKNCKKLQKKIISTEDFSNNKAKQPPSKELQLFLLVSSLIQLNKDGNFAPYSHRFYQLNLKKSTGASLSKQFDIILVHINICGLRTFLEHRTMTEELAAAFNFSEGCKATMKILSELLFILDENERPQLLRQLTTLLFHHNNVIRKESSKLYNEDKIITMTYNLWENLFLTSKELVSPLTKNVSTEYSFPFHVDWGWTVVKENFSRKENRILMHVLCPSTKELEVGVECSPKDERFNELQLLKALQHPHIVQLQAYSESVWPQFYITEDYMVEALQTLLVNKSRKNNFYSMKELLMFSVDAMEGVRYLHSNNIVHRHLTAAHLFISTSGQVKLSGLMHARKLSKDTIRDFHCSLVPTRWSAPESLKECLFSKKSDMWMVGHLIYEILTHGRLPYADIGLDDTEVIPMVVDGTRVLCKESCIPSPIYKVISQLTKIEPSSRLSEVKAVIDVLQSEAKQMNKDMKSMIFPDIREEGQATTEHGKGPIASVLHNTLDPSDDLYSNGNNEVSKIENSKHQDSLRGLIHIQEDCPKDFSTSVFSRLTSCHLPGISPLISRPRITSDEKRELSFWLPSEHNMCSLANAVHSLLLGRDIKEYIQCLANMASVIADLHSYGLVMRDFSAYTIYIEKDPTATGQMTKVWLGSLANMCILHPCVEEEDQHIKIAPPQDNEVCGRAAPEVVKDGLYSHASDVFSFGHLMLWVINGFYEVEDQSSQVYHKIEDIFDSSLGKIPQACPRHIYNLIKWCSKTEKNHRPPIHVVQKYLTGEEQQFPIDIDYENAEDGDIIQNKDNSSSSSGYISESISSTTPNIFCEPPPLPPRRSVPSSISPRSPKERNALSSPEYSPPPRPPRPPKLSTTPLSPPQSPPPLPPSPIKTLSASRPPSLSPQSGTQAALSLHETGPTSPPPLPPRKKSSTLPPSFNQSLDEPLSAPVQQLPSKPQEAQSSPNSLKSYSSLNSLPTAPLSSIVEDQEASSWPGVIQSCKKDHLKSKWLSMTDISVDSPRKLRRKIRSKSDSIKEFTYPLASCDTIHIRDVAEKSGATVRMQTSQPGMKSLVIRGTRGQIQEALRIVTSNTGKKVEIIKTTTAFWIKWVEKAFPDFEKRTYFVPPVCISRVPMVNKISAGHKVLMLTQKNTQDNSATDDFQQTSVQKSDVLDDEAFQRVVFSLKTLWTVHKEVFMCLSQLPFGSYLGNPDFFPATAHLPLPSNLPEKWPISWRQGDFDMLLIHKQYGFVICEVKAMVYNIDTPKEERSKQMTKKLNDAKMQLDKAEAMLSHLVSDIAHDMRITKTIVCPNLTSLEIQEIIHDSQQLRKDLFQCFKLKKFADVSGMIICSDHLCDPEPWTSITAEKVKKLWDWWKAFVLEPGSETRMNTCPDVYKNLVARFCGPASTVTVPCVTEPRAHIKTMGQAVSHVGDCYTAHTILFPEQIELLNRAFPRVFIVGPPGTGKTTVLLLMATEWLRHGHDVYVLSTWESSLAATHMLHHLLQQMLKTHLAKVPTHGRVLVKILNGKKDFIQDLDDLTRAASKGGLHIIADEVGPDHGPESHVFPEFCAQLTDRCKNQDAVLYLWAASCFHAQAPVKQGHQHKWEMESFTRPLRSPPTVIQEIKKAEEIKNQTVQEYTERGVPDFTEGPAVHWISHQSQRHFYKNVEDCNICGSVVAKFLLNELHLGVSLTSHTELSGTFTPSKDSRTPEGLKYRDVLILSLLELREDAPVLKALSNASIPVRVLREQNIQDVATAGSNVVWAAKQQLVRGLERKVVVCLVNDTDEKNPHAFTRLFAMSRCSSQLVVVSPNS